MLDSQGMIDDVFATFQSLLAAGKSLCVSPTLHFDHGYQGLTVEIKDRHCHLTTCTYQWIQPKGKYQVLMAGITPRLWTQFCPSACGSEQPALSRGGAHQR
jgi:hypothetical protein